MTCLSVFWNKENIHLHARIKVHPVYHRQVFHNRDKLFKYTFQLFHSYQQRTTYLSKHLHNRIQYSFFKSLTSVRSSLGDSYCPNKQAYNTLFLKVYNTPGTRIVSHIRACYLNKLQLKSHIPGV